MARHRDAAAQQFLPLLAASAAATRGVAVTEICSVVSVATAAPAKLDDGSSAAAGYGCALALLPIFAAPQTAPPEVGLAESRPTARLLKPHFELAAH